MYFFILSDIFNFLKWPGWHNRGAGPRMPRSIPEVSRRAGASLVDDG
jgi:hypothetical protein